MKKLTKFFYTVLAVLTICFLFVGNSIFDSNNIVSAEEEVVYSTRVNISEQGENGFYYAWGKPEKYALMTYGATAGGGYSFRGIEPYSIISGNYIHPGSYWGVMNIWVAPQSGSIKISGKMIKGSSFGDGVTLAIHHQNYGGKLETLEERFIGQDGALIEYAVNETLNVNKGDTIIFYCDSGKGKDNTSDSADFSCEIAYLEAKGDIVENEDLSKYLNIGTPAEIAGVHHVEQGFEAEVLDGTLTEVVIKEGGCAASVSTTMFLPFIAVTLLIIRRKR